MLKIQVHGIMFGGDATDVPALPRCGETPSGQGNGAAPMGTDKVMAVEGDGGCDLMKCAECEKVFKSGRALYGHLRWHPEKGYRGASRPANDDAAAAVGKKKAKKPPKKERQITDEEAAMILMEMSWGQRQEPEVPMHRPPHQTPGPEQPMLPDPVANAAAVAQAVIPDHVTVAGQHMWEAEKPAQVEHALEVVMGTSAEAEHALRAEHVAKVTTEPQSTEVIKRPTKPEPVADGVLVLPLNEHGVAAAGKPASPGAHNSKKVSPCARKSKKRKLQDLEQAPVTPSTGAADVKPPARRIPSPASDRRYMCPFAKCGKTFFTQQALGGHVAGHNRDKDGGTQHVDALAVAHARIKIHHHRHAVGDAASAGLREESRDNPPAPTAQSQAQHRCSHPNCNMLFPSGQSLGGHMRKHRQLAQATKASSSAPQPAQATEASSPPQPVPSGMPRDFDLNELPRDEEENKP